MKIYKGKIIAMLAACVVTSAVAAIPNTSSNPKTFLGPTAHLGVVKSITDESAFALAGDLGPKNLRASGTIGWEFDYHQRMKATAEYLQQQLTYSFFTGTEDVWVKQGAVGLNYQYDFRQVDPFNTLLDLTGYYAHSPSRNLGVSTGSYVTNGVTTNYVDYQRIAGADAFGVSPGITIQTLEGTRAGLELNYDNVQYDNANTPGKYSKGLGGTLRLNQEVAEDVSIGGSAAVRRPYNIYAANITFSNLEYYGTWSVSGFGDYSIGKNTQPSSYNVGLGADYFIDGKSDMTMPQPKGSRPAHYKDYKDYKDLPPMVWKDPVVEDKDLLNWVGVPAIKIPNVYSVPDEKVSVCSNPPVFLSFIPAQSQGGSPPWSFDVSSNFSGSGLVWSIAVISVTSGSPDVTISQSGVITVDAATPVTFTVIVTVTNTCGVASSNEFEIDAG